MEDSITADPDDYKINSDKHSTKSDGKEET
jgi:hypothetical protein